MANGPLSNFGSGNLGSRLVYRSRINSIGEFVHQLANDSTEKAVIDLGYRFGENTRQLIKNFTGGNILSNLGNNIKRY